MDCLICFPCRKVLHGKNMDKTKFIVSLSERITSSLYNKYAESQNYYYTKIVNDLILNQPTKATIQFKDLQQYDEDAEYCKKLYTLNSYPKKIKILVEFYRFHKEIPRWAVNEQIVGILNEFYNQKRKQDYYKIQFLVQQENQQNPNKTPKGIVGEQPQESESTPISNQSSYDGPIVGNVLDELNTEIKQRTQTLQSEIDDIVKSLNQQPIKQQKYQDIFSHQQQFIMNEYKLQQFLNEDKMKKIKQLITNQKSKKLFFKQNKKENLQLNFKKQNSYQNNQSDRQQITSKLNTPRTSHAQILNLLKQRVKAKLELKLKSQSKGLTNNSSLKSLQKNINQSKTPRNIQFQNKQRFDSSKQIKAKTFHVDQSSKNLIISLLANKNTTVHISANQKNLLLAKLHTLNTPRQILH